MGGTPSNSREAPPGVDNVISFLASRCKGIRNSWQSIQAESCQISNGVVLKRKWRQMRFELMLKCQLFAPTMRLSVEWRELMVKVLY